MSNLDTTLTRIGQYLKAAKAKDLEWTIFGSTSLILHGVLKREPGDIDMFVSKRVWGEWLALDDWHVETPAAGDPPILVNDTTPIVVHAFYDWENSHVIMDIPQLLHDSEYVNGYRCIPVCDALSHKKYAFSGDPKLKKHKVDIKIIEGWVKVHGE